MKNKILISSPSLTSLVASGTMTSLVPIDRAQAQMQAASNNPALLAQTQLQRSPKSFSYEDSDESATGRSVLYPNDDASPPNSNDDGRSGVGEVFFGLFRVEGGEVEAKKSG